jgi:hypothetical protein
VVKELLTSVGLVEGESREAGVGLGHVPPSGVLGEHGQGREVRQWSEHEEQFGHHFHWNPPSLSPQDESHQPISGSFEWRNSQSIGAGSPVMVPPSRELNLTNELSFERALPVTNKQTRQRRGDRE